MLGLFPSPYSARFWITRTFCHVFEKQWAVGLSLDTLLKGGNWTINFHPTYSPIRCWEKIIVSESNLWVRFLIPKNHAVTSWMCVPRAFTAAGPVLQCQTCKDSVKQPFYLHRRGNTMLLQKDTVLIRLEQWPFLMLKQVMENIIILIPGGHFYHEKLIPQPQSTLSEKSYLTREVLSFSTVNCYFGKGHPWTPIRMFPVDFTVKTSPKSVSNFLSNWIYSTFRDLFSLQTQLCVYILTDWKGQDWRGAGSVCIYAGFRLDLSVFGVS